MSSLRSLLFKAEELRNHITFEYKLKEKIVSKFRLKQIDKTIQKLQAELFLVEAELKEIKDSEHAKYQCK